MKLRELLEAVDEPLVISMLRKLLKKKELVLFSTHNSANTYNDQEGAKITSVEMDTTASGRPMAEIFYIRADNGEPDSNIIVGRRMDDLKLTKGATGWELRYTTYEDL
jgi:hypothetical protein